MSEQVRGPKLDRTLLRLKDAIIIGTALIALIKWFYIKPIQMEENQKRQEELLTRIAANLDIHTRQLADIEKRLAQKQPSLSGYHPKKGGWVMIKGKWYFVDDEEIQREEDH
jgi:glucan-binding YG repeat protein